ncbi:MAG: DUF1559 domain-containing protein [Thermoguttaceae bacterium]
MQKKHLGFTLVELLVVISIIGMLMGLLLPAVNFAREAGRRTTCMNNQRNLALAIANYDGALKELPTLRKKLPNSNWELTWVAQLLPYMEQAPLYNNITTMSLGDESAWVRAASATGTAQETELEVLAKAIPAIAVLRCPTSAPEAPGAWPSNRMSYVVNAGPQNMMFVTTALAKPYYQQRSARNYGIFFDTACYNTAGQPSSMDFINSSDGQSNTILLTESMNAGRWLDFGIVDDTVAAPGTVADLKNKYGTCGVAVLPKTIDGTAPTTTSKFGFALQDYQGDGGFTIPATVVFGIDLNSTDTTKNNLPTDVNACDGGMTGWNWSFKTTPRDKKVNWVFAQYPAEYTGVEYGTVTAQKDMYSSEEMTDMAKCWDYRTAKINAFKTDAVLFQYPSGDVGQDDLTMIAKNATNDPPRNLYTRNQFPARTRYSRPASEHPAMIVVAMCDGSARTINDNIDPVVYTFMVTPKDGMVIDAQP